MAAFKYTLRIDQGATLEDTVTYKSGSPAAAVDLTGCTARAQVRSDIASTTVLLELSTTNGGIVLGGAAGTIKFFMTPAATAALTFTKAVYDMELTFADGRVRRLMEGQVVVSKEVTR